MKTTYTKPKLRYYLITSHMTHYKGNEYFGPTMTTDEVLDYGDAVELFDKYNSENPEINFAQFVVRNDEDNLIWSPNNGMVLGELWI